MRMKDITNQQFGRLTVIEVSYKGQDGHYHWLCSCNCGNQITVSGNCLRTGKTTSCGCYSRERRIERLTKHGHSTDRGRTPTYYSWDAMKKRCLNSNDKDFKHYGGRGITIHEPWIHSFEQFLADMGERPEGTTLDRIDPNGNYEPSNCRWADAKTQANNKRKTSITP